MNDFAKDLLGEGIEDENKNHPGYVDVHGDDDEVNFDHIPDEDDEEDYEDDDEDDGQDPEIGAEADFKEVLESAGFSVETFEENGVMTHNRGLVVTGRRGTFQLTIVRSR